jgi:Tol biopolymer transport system component
VVGRTLSHYRVDERLGAGGMGEVYRARDLKLDRDVALKVLPENALADEAARSRFRKEAHALSRLSHPHVAHLLDFDSENGTDFLVMELVAGSSLDEALRPGPLSEKDALRLGAQLARGLQAAHERGVVHRDLKPSNLHLTKDGLLKILDFGVARFAPGPEAAHGHTTATETAAGAVVGSPPYMAPEQLLGKPSDARSDLYSAGAVLYELVTGQRPFGSRSGVALTDAILHEPPPPPGSLGASVSPAFETVILKALDKDPDLRYQTARELLVDLERLGRSSPVQTAGGETLAPPKTTRRRALLRLGAVVVIAAFAAALVLLWPPGPPRITATRPLNAGLDGQPFGDVAEMSWATDGRRLYYLGSRAGRMALFQVPVNGGEAVESPLPFRDGNVILGYIEGESALLMAGLGQLWRVPVPAGAPARVGDLEVHWAAAVSPDGLHFAVQRERNILVARGDGSAERTLGPLPTAPIGLAWSPDGRTIRYCANHPEAAGHWIWEVPAGGGEARPLWPGRNGSWSGDGRYFLFDRGGDLYAVRERGWLRGQATSPVRLTAGPLRFEAPITDPDGKGLYAWGGTNRGELVRLDLRTRRLERYLDGVSANDVDATRDGEWLAWVSHPERVLWRGRPDGTGRTRLTASGWRVLLPRWSPDGLSIVFAAWVGPDETKGALYLLPREGGQPKLLVRNTEERNWIWDSCWSDSRTVVFSWANGGRPGIYRVDVPSGRVDLVPGAERLLHPKCSPKGDILAGVVPDGQPRLYRLLRAGRAEWEDLAAWHAGYQNWSSDGLSLVALGAKNRIERLTLATRKVEILAELGDSPLVGPDGVPWLGLAHDGSPLVTRDRSMLDLYAFDWEAP